MKPATADDLAHLIGDVELLTQGQLQTLAVIDERGVQALALPLEVKAPVRQTVRPPTVTRAEGVVTRPGAFGLQHIGHHRGHRFLQMDRFLMEETV